MLTRRTLLGAAAAAALAGCSSAQPPGSPSPTGTAARPSPSTPVGSPQPSTHSSTQPSTPSPTDLQSRSATLELRAAGQAAGLLAGTDDKARKRLYLALRDAQLDHASAVLSPVPTDRPPPAVDAPSVKAVQASRAQLKATLRSAATLYEPAAVAATGLDALLWGSLHVAARSYGKALDDAGSVDKPPTQRLPPELLTDTGALQAVVAQLHAMIFGYQLALGQLKVLSSAHRRASSGLAARRALRDQLVVALIDRLAEVPVAAAAYVPPIKVRNAATAGEVIRRMEIAFRPFCGQWLASAETSRLRRDALAALVQTDDFARSWGASAQVWPGWP